jgi:hypothetical protein
VERNPAVRVGARTLVIFLGKGKGIKVHDKIATKSMVWILAYQCHPSESTTFCSFPAKVSRILAILIADVLCYLTIYRSCC